MMADNFNPNAEAVPGLNAPPPGSSLESVSRTGQPHLLTPAGYGRGGTGRNGYGYGHNEMLPLDDYFKSRAAIEKVPSISSADDNTLAGWANDYASQQIPGALEGVYQRKADKNEIESHVSRFNAQFINKLPELRQHFAKLENAAGTPAAAPPSPTATVATSLGKQALGTAETGTASALRESPNILAQLSNPLVNPTAIAPKLAEVTAKALRGEKIALSDFYSPVVKASAISPTLNPLVRPAAESLQQSGEANLPGGKNLSPEEAEAAKQHPTLSTIAQVAGGAAPLLAASVGGPGAVAAVGAAESGGSVRKEHEDRINAMKDADLAKIPEYQTLLKQVGDPTKAKALLAQAAGEAAGNVGELFGGITGTFGGGALTKPVQSLITRLVGTSVLKRVLASAGAEAGGLTASGAAQQVAETGQVNKATGENNTADINKGGASNALLGVLFGGLGALLHNPLKAGKKPVTEETPGAAPPTEQAPAGDVYKQAYEATVENPEHQVKTGTPLEQATPTLIEALDQFNARYAALHEGATPEDVAAAGAKFEQDWKRQFNVQEPAPQVKETATPQQPVSEADAAAAVGPEAPVEAVAPEAAPVAPGEAREAVEGTPPAPGEAREAAPTVGPVAARDLATQRGVDTRLPLGLTEKTAEELRQSLGRDPAAHEINKQGHLILDTAMNQKGVNRLLPVIARREAVGKLLEADGTRLPTAEEINTEAQRMLAHEGAQTHIDERLKLFGGERQVPERRTNRLIGQERKAPLLKQIGAEKKVEPPKLLAQERKALTHEPDITVKKGGTNVLRKGVKSGERVTGPGLTEQAPRPKGEAAEQDSEAAYLRKAGEKDEFGNAVSGRAAHEVRKEIADGVPGKIKGVGRELYKTLLKLDKLQVVQSMKDLPPEALAAYNKHPEAGPIKGYYDPKTEKSWLVADHLAPGEAVPTVLHEVGAHYGLQRMLLPSLYSTLEKYVEATRHLDTPDGRELAKAYADAIAAKVHPKLALNETMATMITNRGLEQGSIWGRAFAQLKAFLYNRFGKYLPESLANKLVNNDTIVELARGALKWTGDLKKGIRATDEPWMDHPGMFSRAPTNFKTVEDVREAWHKIEPPSKEQTAQVKESKMREWATKHVNELKPLQYLNRDLEKAGVKVEPSKDIFAHITRLASRAQHESDHDVANYVDPAITQMLPIIERLGFKGKVKEFLAHANDAVAGRHALERNKLLYMQTVRLTDEAEQARASLLSDVFAGKVKPDEYMPALKQVVMKPGAIIEKTGKRMGSGLSDEMAYKLIESAKKAGITDKVAGELNGLLDPVRQRTLQNGYRSRRYTPEQRSIQKAYGFKWYVPFKGFADDTPNGVDNSRRPLGAFNKDEKYLEGRQTQSKNPLENLLADLTASSRDVAYNEAAESVFRAGSDKAINAKLGTKIKAYDINKMTADALAGGGKLSDMESIFRSPDTVIYNNGTHRFSIQFPEGSKELEAIKTAQKTNTLDGVSKAVGRLTNLFARAKTAYSPVFDLFTALVRDTSTYPLMAGIEHGPKVVANYAGNLLKFGGPLGAWRTYVGGLRGKSFAEIEKRAVDNPDSFAGWAYRLGKSGGGLEFRQELNNVKDIDTLAQKIANAQGRSIKHVGKDFLSFLDAFATSSIAAGRVSMFKALVDSGMADAEAGLYTKRLLNFQQSSEGSRRMNAYFAFWRAGIANADRLNELMRNKDGSFNRGRFGAIMTMGIGAAAAWNGVLKSYYGDKAKDLTQDTVSKNFILPYEINGEPVKLPMGLGLPRLMLGLGMLGTRLAEGDASLKDTLEATKTTLFENLSPLKPAQSKENASAGDRAFDLLMAAVPSPARPVAELGLNRTIFAHDITPTPAPGDTRYRSDSGWRSTPKEWKELAEGIRSASGVDVYPESLEYISNAYGAGFMTELLRGFVLENKEQQGKETSIQDYPFVPRITTGDLKNASARGFYEQKDRLQEAVKEANTLKEQDKRVPLALQKELDEQKKFQAESRAHSKAIKQIEENKLLSASAKASRLAQLNADFKRTQERLSKEAERIN